MSTAEPERRGTTVTVRAAGRDAARGIWLNVELAKKPASSLEYILVHEMIHIHERRLEIDSAK